MSNPEDYNAAILGKIPEEYCKWISNKETWGGGIELSILSKFFHVQIGVADIQFLTFEYFGNYDNCIYLLYNNIHYYKKFYSLLKLLIFFINKIIF